MFLGLVDSNAQVNAYRQSIGLYKDQINSHMVHITFYREVTKLVNEIKTLLKNKNGNEEKIDGLRTELKLKMENWKK